MRALHAARAHAARSVAAPTHPGAALSTAGIKGHEPQYVFPISFNADGTIPHFTWNDSVTFSVDAAAGEPAAPARS